MANKKIPEEVVTAMTLAAEAGWKVSNRNRKITITPPNYPPLTIGYNPNEMTLKEWRSSCTRFNLLQGPARTPEESAAIVSATEKQALAEADRINARRRAYEAAERAKKDAIEAVQAKSTAAILQGMAPAEKSPVSTSSSPLPAFDKSLLTSRESADFILPDGTLYCINCLAEGQRATFKAPQGLAAHRGSRHGFYQQTVQETSRVILPADVDTALEMLRTAISDSIAGAETTKDIKSMEAELVDLRQQVKLLTEQSDQDKDDHSKLLQEVRQKAQEALGLAKKEAQEARESEVRMLMQNFLAILTKIKEATEELSPIQAIARIDMILKENLNAKS